MLYTVDETADYLTTQSNVIAAVERGGESLAEAHEWLVGQMKPLFPRGARHLRIRRHNRLPAKAELREKGFSLHEGDRFYSFLNQRLRR